MFGRTTSFRVRLIILGSCAAISLLGTGTGSALGLWQDASSPYASSKFGSCNAAVATSFSYSVSMFTQSGYTITRTQPSGGKCYSLREWHPYTAATKFVISPDLTSAELRGPTTNFGTVYVKWTANSTGTYDALSGSGAWFPDPTEPTPADAGAWVEVARAATATGSFGLTNLSTASAWIALGTGAGIYT